MYSQEPSGEKHSPCILWLPSLECALWTHPSCAPLQSSQVVILHGQVMLGDSPFHLHLEELL